MAPQTSTASNKRTRAAEASADAPEPTPDPDGDLAEERFTRYESSEAFIASLEQRSWHYAVPTHDETATFRRDFAALTPENKRRLLQAIRQFVADLQAMEREEISEVRAGLRIRRLTDVPGVFEMTWAPDGRATFSWGTPIREAQRHVQWRRCGTHDIFRWP